MPRVVNLTNSGSCRRQHFLERLIWVYVQREEYRSGD